VNEHLRQNIPFCGTVAYSNHEITFDNPTNHLIRHALTKVKRKWGRWMMGDNRLTEVRLQLELSTPTWQPGDVMACVRRKENRVPIKHPYFLAQYEPLRQLSLALLREEGASLYQQHHEAEGVIFDGSWLWEEYLWTLLEPLGFEHPENKKGVGPWNALPGVRFYPDFFHREDRVILDAKYKRRGGVQDDARQVFAYMFLLNAVHGGLIKPDGMPEARQQIEREGKGAEPAHWHNFVLSPPPAFPAESSAEDFVDKMRMREKEFTECVRSRFGITKAILGSVG
jgi:5-methylcytosine-specific restriction endonuclease McrBC regulatory subunit McrC